MCAAESTLKYKPDETGIRLLGQAPKGFRGAVEHIDASTCTGVALSPSEIEHRLMEMGFTRGALVEIRHEGLWGKDPIAVRVDHATVALRRQIANAVHVRSLMENEASLSCGKRP